MENILDGEVAIKIVGIVAGILTSVSMFPQIIKIIREKEAKDISVNMVIILIIGIACWIFYGVLRKDLPIIFTNSFSLLVNVMLLVLFAKYKHR